MDKEFIKNPVEAYEKLKEENKKLKAENETYKKMLEDEEVILALNEVRTGERHLWFNKAEKLKQALTEIKEICNKESGWVNCSNNMPTETAIFAEQILQKISEVINER